MREEPLSNPEDVETVEENAYYLHISRKLTRARYLALLLLVITVALVLWGYRNRITYDNLRYLLRDVDEAASASVLADAVYYSANDTNLYLQFRGDLAVCSSEGVSLRRSLGGRSFDDNPGFKAPVAKCSEKYMIVYDVGGNSVYLYNSVSRVADFTFVTPVLDCAVAKNGAFAVATREKTGDYKISLYDKNFDLRAAITRSGLVYSIDFVGEQLAISECKVANGALGTDFSLYTSGKDELDQTVFTEGTVLLAGEYGKGFFFLTDRALKTYASDGSKETEQAFGMGDVLFADANKSGVSVCVAENTSGGNCAVYSFSPSEVPAVQTVAKGVKSFARVGNSAVALYDGSLVVCDGLLQNRVEIPASGRKLLAASEDAVTVCFDDYAKTFSVK